MANTATVTVMVPPAVRGWDDKPPTDGPGEVVIADAGNDPVHYPISKDGTVTVPAAMLSRFLVLVPGAAATEEASS